MVKTRIEVFPDIAGHIDFFEELPEYDAAMYTHKKMKTNSETSLKVLTDLLPVLEAQDDYSNDALYAVLSRYVEENGVKTGYVMWPIRTAVSGKQMTPAGATEIMEVLGKEESLSRGLCWFWQDPVQAKPQSLPTGSVILRKKPELTRPISW